jgi:hypothetical protein
VGPLFTKYYYHDEMDRPVAQMRRMNKGIEFWSQNLEEEINWKI